MSEPSKEAMEAAMDLSRLGPNDYYAENVASIIDAAHAHIREQAKAWRAWCAMAHFAPTLVANLYGYHVDHEYGIGLTCPTRESAMIAAADAALGEGWDKESA